MMQNSIVYIIGIPIIAGILCLAIPDKLKIITRAIALCITLAAFIVSVYIFLAKPVYWPAPSSSIFLVDTLSGFIGAWIGFFALLVTVYSSGFVSKDIGRYFGYVLMTLGASFGVAFSNNLIGLVVFWGFLAVTLYMLVNIARTDAAASAAKKALLIIGATDSLLIFGVGLIWLMTGTFSIDKIHLALNSKLSFIAFLAIASAGFAKAGVMPFHSWLPDVAEAGPTPVTAYLPASFDKLLGIYLLVRLSLNIFIMNHLSNLIFLLVGSITIVLAVVFALVQHDFKRLLGYHAVSQVGYMVLGLGTGNPVGIAGGLFHMLNNTVYKTCLFLSGGNVEKKTGITDLARLGGLAKYMPVTFICFLVASLSISGIPPFNGFVSKWMIYQGIIQTATAKNPLWIIWLSSAMFGSALTLASFMKLLHAIFLGRPSKELNLKDMKESGFSMSAPVSILAIICVVFGVFAFLVPLKFFIAPAIGMPIAYLGTWTPIMATLLIVIGILFGLAIYGVSNRKQFRRVDSFVGGADADTLERVSGTEFYNTIKDIKVLGAVYKKEEEKKFDIYSLAKGSIGYFTRYFQYLHNGVLPTYMVWCLLGMVGMFVIIFFR